MLRNWELWAVRVTAKQMEIAKQFSLDVDKLMPEPEPEPGPLPLLELFPKHMAWMVLKKGGATRLNVMQSGVPLNGKPITNVRNPQSTFWRSMLRIRRGAALCP